MPLQPQYYTLVDGQPQPELDPDAWVRWLSTANRRVELTRLVDGNGEKARVSTVFLGEDKSFSNEAHDPILWETLVIGGTYDSCCGRWASEEEARHGHAQFVEMVRAPRS